MDEDKLNLEIRKFLKQVGIHSQREIEKAVRGALVAGRIEGSERLAARMSLSVPAIGLNYVLDEEIALE